MNPLKAKSHHVSPKHNAKVDKLEIKKGFSLIEVLVAISILLTSVTPTLFVASKGILFAGASENRVTASYLAEEVIEYIRNVRDNNLLDNKPWLQGLSTCTGGAVCVVDVPNDTVCKLGSAGCSSLVRRSGAGLFNHNTGEATVFNREVTIETVSAGEEVVVEVTVTWPGATRQQQTLKMRPHLFNWL